jgi:branched-chain amino acid transport system permease protein
VLGYLFAGIALGSIYAIAASGIVVTYVSSGVLNFAFGSIAFFLARFYYFLNTQHGWGQLPAVVVSVFLAGPALGALLYLVLFRHLRLASSLIKIVSTIGVSVALPSAALILFGNQTITTAPGLASQPEPTYKVFGAVATLDQIIAFGCVLAVVIIGTVILQFTDVGLKVRAMVDTEAMTSLSGVSPARISICVWMVTTTLAGLVGVLAAPSSGLTPDGMTALMASAFAAVVAARLRSLPVTVGVAMAMGIVTDVIQDWLPANNSLTSAIITSIPFFVMGAFLLAYILISGRINEAASTGGALDRAIRPMGGDDEAGASAGASAVTTRTGWSWYMLGPVAIIAIVALLPALLPVYWLTLLAGGLAFGIIFLSFTMVMGEGGMIWLCQATFAGCGAIATAQLATNHGFNPLLAVLIGGLVTVPIGVIIGLLTIRLGNLYVALVTVTFGLLFETLIFTRNLFYQDGFGVVVRRPGFLVDNKSFSWFCLAVFVVIALFVVNLRRSTTGLALAAVRSSEPGARTTGLSVLGMKLLVAGIAAFIAAVGGGLLSLNYGSALPLPSYATFGGLVWLAVFVTIGLRSITAAVIGGIAFTLLPGVFQTYLPVALGNVPTLLFGLGAIAVAANPEGQVAANVRMAQNLALKIIKLRTGDKPTAPAVVAAAAGGTDAADIQETSPVSALAEMTSPVSAPAVVNGVKAASTAPRLECHDVTVRFGGIVAVSSVSLSVPPATIVGLVGPNGAGKSTLFSVLSGLHQPNEGRVLFEGANITQASAARRARLGLARTFQHPEMFTGLTTREHIQLALRASTSHSRIWSDVVTGRGFRPADKEEATRVDVLLDALRLTEIADRPVAGLPLGMTRLVEIARALAANPKVVLFDEPSSGLDAQETEQVMRVLERAVERTGVSLLLVEHDVGMVLRLCSYIYVLDFGETICEGTPAEIRANPAVHAAYLGDDLEAETEIETEGASS